MIEPFEARYTPGMRYSTSTDVVDGEPGIVNDLEIRQVGMSRSGNHALINWILKQVPGRYCFLNCAEPQTNPFVTARPLEHGRVLEANYPVDLAAERDGRSSRRRLLLFSHEDCFLGPLSRPNAFERHHDEWVGRSRRRVDLLLLRDPLNLFASRLKGGLDGGASHTAMRIWKQHARQFLGLRDHLRDDRILVRFDRWVGEVDYRREIAERLGLPFTDAGRRQVPGVASGSSFDGTSFDGEADVMPVLERWRWLKENGIGRVRFDPEVVELARGVFGEAVDVSLSALSESVCN